MRHIAYGSLIAVVLVGAIGFPLLTGFAVGDTYQKWGNKDPSVPQPRITCSGKNDHTAELAVMYARSGRGEHWLLDRYAKRQGCNVDYRNTQ